MREPTPRRELTAARAAALAALALSCATFGTAPVPGPDEGPWAQARIRYERAAKVYDRFGAHAFASAVYQAPEVRAQRVARLAEWKSMTEAERSAALAAELAEGDKHEDFLVSLFTVNRKANDLDARSTSWRVALVVPGEGEELAQSIEELRADPALRMLYPSIGEFDVVYRVRFARWRGQPLAGRSFILRIAGPEGRIDLDFGALRVEVPR